MTNSWVPKQANIRVMTALREAGLDDTIIRHETEARTAVQAAEIIGCDLAQICKSLVFDAGGEIVLVLVSGANRVDTARLAALLGKPIGKADAEAVRAATGYAIGGVAPLGHPTRLITYMDDDLLKHETIYPAGGTPNTAFAINSQDLQRVTGAIIADVKE
jgi:Cys-tRNA(Pro) deacylase